MKRRITTQLLIAVVAVMGGVFFSGPFNGSGGGLVAGSVAHAQAKGARKARNVDYKLKPGAAGSLCRGCHTDFDKALANKSLHTPVRKGECTGCHDPHAAKHGKLLVSEAEVICQSCHKNVPKNAVSTHAPAREGKCNTCHEVHAADNASLLLVSEKKLCTQCHAELIKAADKAKYKHSPVEKNGCRGCHNPHGSNVADHLLKDKEKKLCTGAGCHSGDKAKLAKLHNGYPVHEARCSGCHNPHGSDQPGLLRNSVHAPVAKGQCGKCHNRAGATNALQTTQSGGALCQACHAKDVKKMMAKDRVHWAMFDEVACLRCHTPHASDRPKLVVTNMAEACGACHPDTIARQTRSPTKHTPVNDDCSACHESHSSNNVMMLKQNDQIKLCAACHNWEKHSSHPLGPKFRDPRNPNRTVDCLSCHRAHGTEHEHLMPNPTTTAMCIQCHEDFNR